MRLSAWCRPAAIQLLAVNGVTGTTVLVLSRASIGSSTLTLLSYSILLSICGLHRQLARVGTKLLHSTQRPWTKLLETINRPFEIRLRQTIGVERLTSLSEAICYCGANIWNATTIPQSRSSVGPTAYPAQMLTNDDFAKELRVTVHEVVLNPTAALLNRRPDPP